MTASGEVRAVEVAVEGPAVVLRGEIVPGDFERLRQLDWSKLSRVDVDLIGGSAGEALQIARLMHEREIDLRVVGVCLSSCANYLFVAAKRKSIEPGAVLGLHGALATTPLDATVIEGLRTSLRGQGVPESELDERISRVRAQRDALQTEEAKFAVQLKVNLAYYEDVKTAMLDARKRVPGEAPDYPRVWWPSANRMLHCYNIGSVMDKARPANLDQSGYHVDVKRQLLLVGDAGFQNVQHCR